jgi:two-component system, cell cycle response regulator
MARILVIEDNPTNMELMVYLLQAFGHVALTAGNGESGLDAVQSERPDLIICDVHLPRMDGYEVARRLKSNPALRQIPLVAVTALAMMGDRDKVLQSGFDGYLSKPIAPETFVAQVQGFLPPEQRTGVRPTPAKSTGRTGPLPSQHRTILVVDNRYENIDVLRATLEPSGYEVRAANTVSEALASAREQQPDLILSDVFLGGESGHSLLKATQVDPALKSIPFLFISSTSWAEHDAAYALQKGAKAYITRPIEPEALLAHIRKWLGSTEIPE